MNFVHLHVHSHYSLLDGLGKIDELIAEAKRHGMNAIALTDHGNLYGAVEFYQKAKKEGIKPILGLETYITGGKMTEKDGSLKGSRYHLILLAENNEGWKNLIKISTLAHLEGFYYKPRADKDLLRKYSGGIIALSGCLSGEIPKALEADNKDKALKLLREYKDIFGEKNFFIEISHHPNIPNHTEVQNKLIGLAKETGTPLVATQDVHYVHHDDAPYQDVLLAVQTNSHLDDEDRLTMKEDDFSLRSGEVIRNFFSDTPEAIENTAVISDRVSVSLGLGKIQLPHFHLPKNETAETYLSKLVYEQAKNRYHSPLSDEIKKRIEYELKTIQKTGFSSYFLIVEDIVRWAKSHGIVVGPGRGSAAGSIISYILGITEVDPIKYDLLFERFINPDRISQPDIDLDFADTRRDEIIDHICDKYGRDHVAQIITFGTMASRAAIRDAGRALGLSYGLCDEIAKMIPFGSKLDEAIKKVPELQASYDQNPDTRKIIDSANHLEGVVRHVSTHACGVVITKEPLSDTLPLQLATTGSGEKTKSVVTQFEMHSVEALGLLKMDILGLSNLSIIEETLNLIKKRHGKNINITSIPLNDEHAFEMLAEGRTIGVFQLEGSGMTRYLKELKPTNIEDIIAMISLYRPGTLESGMVPRYIARKHGDERVTYPHPLLEPYLKNTYGIMIYQEQLMQMSQAVAGFTPGEADTLRKAIGKKIGKLLYEQKEKFIDGVVKKTGSEKLGNKLWELILPFERYGFNRSHAVSYAFVACQTAWLKHYYTVEFMTSLLNSDSKNIDRIAFLVAEYKKEHITVLPPDINESRDVFTVVEDNKIRFGLGAIKNVGHNVVTTIIEERDENGKFESLTQFLERIFTRDLNKKSLEALIKSGAMDSLGERNKMLENMETLLSYLKENQIMKQKNQETLFGLMDDLTTVPDIRLKETEPASKMTRLIWEKELLGLYVSGHPLQQYKQTSKLKHNIRSAKQITSRANIQIVALISNVKRILTRAGEPMAFIKLEDQGDSIEAVAFPSALKQYGQFFEQNNCVLIDGTVTIRNGSHNIICNKISPLK